jgi:hypothetical protein
LAVPIRRRLAYVAASVIAAAGMFVGDGLGDAAREAGGESLAAAIIGIGSWIVAGIAAVLLDRTVPARAVGFASLGLPLVWFGATVVSDDRSLWWAGLLLLGAFAALAALSAAATKLLFRVTERT